MFSSSSQAANVNIDPYKTMQTIRNYIAVSSPNPNAKIDWSI